MSLIYFGVWASSQYESETRFTVRSSTPALGKDQIGKVTGLPAAKIVQDTQIVADYIRSEEIIRALAKRVDLHAVYGDPSIDYWSRLLEDSPWEDILEYWQSMVSTRIDPASGIITVRLRAFKPEDAQSVLKEVVAASEAVVNDINNRIWRDVSTSAQQNLDRAAEQLKSAREALQLSRNQAGVLSVEGTTTVINKLIGDIESERLELQQQYDAKLQSVSRQAPQMLVLKRKIEAKEKQTASLREQLAGSSGNARNLADVSTEFAQKQLEQELAEQQFSASVKTFEQIQFVSRQQLLYLDAYLLPQRPDTSEYPKRVFWIVCVLIGSFAVWGVVLGCAAALRRQMS
ncbi:capsule biosynthesis protein [Ensifer sp. LC163]|uniref:capsule biosynthesis protein n=1 Tax=Ensifer sp. LC163 TaxID=1120652 RepID=UPI001FCD031E|nr:capsule biosynthesis protein [Ensifer sp. LC163]